MENNMVDNLVNSIKKRNITCIVCPQGCNLEVWYNNDVISEIKGYTCKRGLDYGWAESTNPTRMLTTTVRIEGGELPVMPVKSEKPIPKELLLESMDIINKIKLKAPIKSGEVILENILDTGVSIVATRDM